MTRATAKGVDMTRAHEHHALSLWFARAGDVARARVHALLAREYGWPG